MSERIFPRIVVHDSSPNQSSRNGQSIKLIVVHATSSDNINGSKSDLENLGSWFSQSAAQVSSHVATDGDGNSARFVPDYSKAWHCMSFNGVSLGVEQIGQAYQTKWSVDEVKETARWLAYWSNNHGVPLRKARIVNGYVVLKGIKRHSELGAAGGNHDDPGPGYPLAQCIQLAKKYKKAQRAYEKRVGHKVTR